MSHRIITLQNDEERVETGVTQIGDDDWPGVFIRGDNAAYFAMCLDDVLDNTCDPISECAVKGLSELLKSSNISGGMNK